MVLFCSKKKKMFLFYMYNFYLENLIYKWIKAIWKSIRECSKKKKSIKEWPYFLGNILVGVKSYIFTRFSFSFVST